MNTFSAGSMVRFGWETFKKRPWFFVGVFIILSILSNLSLQSQGDTMDSFWSENVLAWGLVSIAIFLITTVAKMGAASFALKAHDAPEAMTFRDMWAPSPFLRFVGATLLKAIVVGGPLLVVVLLAYFTYINMPSIFILALVLGALAFAWLVYMAIRLVFVEFIVMEKGSMPIDALKESYRMTEGNFGNVVRLMIVLLGVYLLGLLALVVGLLVATPVAALAFVHAYRTLQSTSQSPQL